LGTPVYWWGPSAQFKTFVDRWYQVAPQEQRDATFKGRRIVAVVALGDTDVATARHTIGMLTDALAYLEAEFFATVVASGVNGLCEVRGHADVLAEARRVGRAAISG